MPRMFWGLFAGIILAGLYLGISGDLPPSFATVIPPTGFMAGGTATSPEICTSEATAHNITSATDTEIVAASAGKTIYVCSYWGSVGAAATNVYIEKGTSTCTSLTRLGTEWYVGANGSFGYAKDYYTGRKTGSGDDLCISTSAVGPTDVTVVYAQY